jgi:Cdc6-like AAA superfamily ATPase
MYTEVVDLEEMVMTWANDESRRQIAVLGSYGTGKSTFARRIASRTASEYRKDNSRRIPFLIELKEFGSHQDIRGLITHELVNRHHVTNGSFEAFETFNRSGRLLLILDGFDEMKQGLTVDSLLYNFNQIFSLHEAKSKVRLCGRPTLFENESEQNRILSGRALSSVPSAARYINLQMAPPSGEEVCSILINFAEVNAPATLQHVRQFVDRLKVMTRRGRNGGLVDLVSRPVHLPMLVSIMQRREVDPEKLDRATLYREFIDAMIERETLKRQAEFQSVYSADVRRRFAQDLAVEMWTRGEHRTIRASEIPARLVEPFVGPGRPLEAVRRDLMASGFFERKPPDILFVPHKSFLEYLVAERVFIDLFLTGPDSTQDLADIELSEEVMTFLFDMMGPDEWSYAFENWKGCRRFLRQWGRYLRLGRISLSPDAEVVIAAASRQPNVSVLISLLTFYDAKPSWRTNARRKIIAAALMSNDDHVVVHAYRALIRGGSAVSQSTIRRLGVERMWRWVRLGWIALPPDEIAERGNGPAMRTESPHLERVVRSRLASLIRDRSLGD